MVLCAAAASAQSQQLPLMPWPAQVSAGPGPVGSGQAILRLGVDFSIATTGAGSADPRITALRLRTLARLARQTGLPLRTAGPATTPATLTIAIEKRDHAAPQKLGDDESYALAVSSDRIRLSADSPLGAIRGVETFLQLVAPCSSGAPAFCVPLIEVHDQPRFPWRGLSLDVSRHFIPLDGVKRTLDGMAAVKLNVLHWHLSDDQGFRVESKRDPKLQQLGSDGLYYTQAEIKEAIAYARDRGIRIVPEFDVPGHSTSWLAAYPNLASRPGPYQIVHEKDGPMGVMDPTRDSTYSFLDGFVGEMAKLFPDEYFHIGGDEVPAAAWTSQPKIRAFMKSHKLANAAALQAYFNKRLQKTLAKDGKKMVGWDEILAPDLPKAIMIQSWRGTKSLAEAARLGYPGILSAGYYLDLMQSSGQHYAVDPLTGDAAALAPEEQARILGGEAAMWEELVTPETLDAKLWPRLAAIAERFWSPQSVTDQASMYARLERTSQWLEWLGLTQRSSLTLMRQRLTSGMPPGSLDALNAFASMLEPVKGYERHRGPFGSSTPFNELVDAIPPESDAARRFREAVDQYLAMPSAAGADSLRAQLAAWSRAATEVRPALQNSSLLLEDLPVADAAVVLCKAGIEALDFMDSPAPASAPASSWKDAALAAVKKASAHSANLLLPFAAPVQKLVENTP